MNAVGVVDEDHEGRRFDVHLGDVVVLHPFAAIERGLVVRGKFFEDPVQVRRGDPLRGFEHDLVDLVKDLGDALPRQGRHGEHGRVVDELELLLGLRHHPFVFLFLVGDEVPFVQDDDDRLAGLVRQADDPFVLLGDSFDGIEQNERHVGAVQAFDGPHDAVLLDALGDPAAAPDACRVHQHIFPAVVLVQAVHGVPGRARDGAYDHPVLADERVDERRFSHVGPADDGDARMVLIRFGTGHGKEFCQLIKEFGKACAMLR